MRVTSLIGAHQEPRRRKRQGFAPEAGLGTTSFPASCSWCVARSIPCHHGTIDTISSAGPRFQDAAPQQRGIWRPPTESRSCAREKTNLEERADRGDRDRGTEGTAGPNPTGHVPSGLGGRRQTKFLRRRAAGRSPLAPRWATSGLSGTRWADTLLHGGAGPDGQRPTCRSPRAGARELLAPE